MALVDESHNLLEEEINSKKDSARSVSEAQANAIIQHCIQEHQEPLQELVFVERAFFLVVDGYDRWRIFTSLLGICVRGVSELCKSNCLFLFLSRLNRSFPQQNSFIISYLLIECKNLMDTIINYFF